MPNHEYIFEKTKYSYFNVYSCLFENKIGTKILMFREADGIRTADLCFWKRPLYRPSHRHNPNTKYLTNFLEACWAVHFARINKNDSFKIPTSMT